MTYMNKRFHKPFEQDVHDVTDPAGREIVKHWLKAMNFGVIDNPDQYGIDLIIVNPNTGEEIAYAEVEVRVAWKDKKFPVDRWGQYIHMPTRKEKFIGLDKPMMFCSINRNLTGMLWCRDEFIFNSRIGRNMRQKKNPHEKYYKLDVEKMNWADFEAMEVSLPVNEYHAYQVALGKLEKEKGWV